MDTNWQEHYNDRKNRPPAPFLIKALGFVENRGTAVDLGSGDLVDSQFLLSQGFHKIIAIDKESPPKNLLEQLQTSNFEFVQSSFDEFTFPENEYDLINAHYSLPFNSSETFQQVWNGIEGSLVSGGVFAGQFFGHKDAWNNSNRELTFHTEKEVRNLLARMEILEFEEEEVDRKIASGHMKHWHLFHVIAKTKFNLI